MAQPKVCAKAVRAARGDRGESESKGMKQNETEENNHEKDLFTGRPGLRELRG